MTRIIILLGATATAVGSFASGSAPTPQAAPRIISTTKEGKPILLARVVVTATALPE